MDITCVFCRQLFPDYKKLVQKSTYPGDNLPCCIECLQSKINQQKEQHFGTVHWWSRIQEEIRREEIRRAYVKRIVEIGDFTI